MHVLAGAAPAARSARALPGHPRRGGELLLACRPRLRPQVPPVRPVLLCTSRFSWTRLPLPLLTKPIESLRTTPTPLPACASGRVMSDAHAAALAAREPPSLASAAPLALIDEDLYLSIFAQAGAPPPAAPRPRPPPALVAAPMMHATTKPAPFLPVAMPPGVSRRRRRAGRVQRRSHRLSGGPRPTPAAAAQRAGRARLPARHSARREAYLSLRARHSARTVFGRVPSSPERPLSAGRWARRGCAGAGARGVRGLGRRPRSHRAPLHARAPGIPGRLPSLVARGAPPARPPRFAPQFRGWRACRPAPPQAGHRGRTMAGRQGGIGRGRGWGGDSCALEVCAQAAGDLRSNRPLPQVVIDHAREKIVVSVKGSNSIQVLSPARRPPWRFEPLWRFELFREVSPARAPGTLALAL